MTKLKKTPQFKLNIANTFIRRVKKGTRGWKYNVKQDIRICCLFLLIMPKTSISRSLFLSF